MDIEIEYYSHRIRLKILVSIYCLFSTVDCRLDIHWLLKSISFIYLK